MGSPVATERIFVANRGEIALRAIRAAHKLGLQAVLGASAADRDSLPSREADRTVILGAAAARDSYLSIPRVVHAAKSTGCTSLHPGYGFLSERPELAELCEREGLSFIGPTADSIRRIGDKLSARALATAAGVPVTRGTEGIESVARALECAEQIGYPVITKASAGGGGRGMVVAHTPGDLSSSFEAASATAREAFGDGTLYLERYVEVARHIEVQVLGDGNGRVLHFGERDCSIQRRYQKMIEESPAEILPGTIRDRMHRCAVTLLASIKYRNAGTVEFLYDAQRQEFTFMEVNARIQVEHPVSEEVTGTDLVAAQIQLARGRMPALTQENITPAGHAIEARILAESPRRGFAPSPGRITRWVAPSGAGIRLDTAVESGSLVPPYYDSMIAKLIVHAESRPAAISRLSAALATFVIEGIDTNLEFLRYVVAHPDFHANRTNTRWLETVVLPEFNKRAERSS